MRLLAAASLARLRISRWGSKPALALTMIERVLEAGAPFAWVAADSVYGTGDIEMALRRAGEGYVLGVAANHHFDFWSGKPQVAGTALEIANGLDHSALQRLSAEREPEARGCMTRSIASWPISRRRTTIRKLWSFDA